MDEAWNNFMITGRVTDYLKYKESHEGSFDTNIINKNIDRKDKLA